MQASCRPLRFSCNASNAYRPAIALHRAFVSTLTPKYGVEVSIRDSPTRQRQVRSRRQSIAALSTTVFRGQESSHTPQSTLREIPLSDGQRNGGTGKDEDGERKEQSIGSFDANESNTEAGTLHEQSASGARVRSFFALAEGQLRPQKENTKYSSRQSTWQEHMKLIAEWSTEFSKQRLKLNEQLEVVKHRRRRLEYYGRCINVPRVDIPQKAPLPWALHREEKRGMTALQMLEQEIARFVQLMTPTPAERAARETIISELMAMIAERMPSNVQVELHGSERTGLAMATSDIDIRLDCDREDPREKSTYLNRKLRNLCEAMWAKDDYLLVTHRNAKFPIVNAQHKKTGIDIQIVAAPSTAAQERVTLQYMAELPHLRSLYVLLRSSLGARGLIDVFSGGIGSYGLFVMLVAGIKRRSSHPPVTLVDQLFRFVDFYRNLDFAKYGVSVSPPKLFKKHGIGSGPLARYGKAARERGDPIRAGQWAISARAVAQQRVYQPYLLCLQDPANPHNDLGQKTNAIKHIIFTLDAAQKVLARDMRHADLAAQQNRRWKGESLLLSLVGRVHELNYQRRAKVQRYGSEILEARDSGVQVVDAAPEFASLVEHAGA